MPSWYQSWTILSVSTVPEPVTGEVPTARSTAGCLQVVSENLGQVCQSRDTHLHFLQLIIAGVKTSKTQWLKCYEADCEQWEKKLAFPAQSAPVTLGSNQGQLKSHSTTLVYYCVYFSPILFHRYKTSNRFVPVGHYLSEVGFCLVFLKPC